MSGLSDELELIAEHIGDDQPNLPEGAKNTLLLAAKVLRIVSEFDADMWTDGCGCCSTMSLKDDHEWQQILQAASQSTKDKP